MLMPHVRQGNQYTHACESVIYGQFMRLINRLNARQIFKHPIKSIRKLNMRAFAAPATDARSENSLSSKPKHWAAVNWVPMPAMIPWALRFIENQSTGIHQINIHQFVIYSNELNYTTRPIRWQRHRWQWQWR